MASNLPSPMGRDDTLLFRCFYTYLVPNGTEILPLHMNASFKFSAKANPLILLEMLQKLVLTIIINWFKNISFVKINVIFFQKSMVFFNE